MQAQSKAPASAGIGVLTGAARFLGNFALMCVAMCAGGGILAAATVAVFGAFGYSEPGRAFPALMIVILAVEITAPMTLLMLLQRHPLAHNLEMTAVSLAAGSLVLLGYWFGAVSGEVVAGAGIFGMMCGVLCLGMLLDMLVRVSHYTGAATHPGHAATELGPASWCPRKDSNLRHAV